MAFGVEEGVCDGGHADTTGTGWGPDVIAPIGSCDNSVKPMIFLLVVKVQVIFCSFVCFSDLKSKFHPRR